MTEEISNNRPLVTFALFAYNQEQYICEAVEGAFAQTYRPLEIILSDDGSTDRTFEIMREMAASYQGSARVIVRRNGENGGLAAHINAVAAMARGTIVVMAAGDDISVPHRTLSHVQSYRIGGVEAVFSAYDGFGAKKGPSIEAYEPPRFLTAIHHALNLGGVGTGATYSYRSGVFRSFGELPTEILAEDRVLPLRASITGKVLQIPDRLVKYRTFKCESIRESKLPSRRLHENETHMRTLGLTIDAARHEHRIGAFQALMLKGALVYEKNRRHLSNHRDFRSRLLVSSLLVFGAPFRAYRKLSTLASSPVPER